VAVGIDAATGSRGATSICGAASVLGGAIDITGFSNAAPEAAACGGGAVAE
jgi:hypothetical protein